LTEVDAAGMDGVGDRLSDAAVAATFRERWLRRSVIASLGIGFAIPYLGLLNEITVEGDEILPELPRRQVVFLSNHQTYFMEAIAFFDLVYLRHHLPLEDPFLRFSAAEETMKKSPLTALMNLAGGVTFKRSFREAGMDVKRAVDVEGASRVADAVRSGWLLHFPAGTTKQGAPFRPGVARLLHSTRALAVPVRIDGFRSLLLHKQIPGKLFKACSIKILPPLDLAAFYSASYSKEHGQEVLSRLEAQIGDPSADRPDGA
jgi:1-acyl-sn-glycerol-3-phosphate acyltransferase